MSPSQSDAIAIESRTSYHTTCPPEDFRHHAWGTAPTNDIAAPVLASSEPRAIFRHESALSDASTVTESCNSPEIASKFAELDVDSMKYSIISTSSQADSEASARFVDLFGSGGMQPVDAVDSTSSEYSAKRLYTAYSSSYLRPGSKFRGEQTSENDVYSVEVELKNVDMKNSFLCGFLRIQGLTSDQSTLTTYFEGEMIGTKYSFLTRRPDWGSNDKKDLESWQKFPAARPLERSARKPSFSLKNFEQREHIFMRWKEHFVVPDHSDKELNGASFAGFYYICVDQLKGEISGIYYHTDNKRTQKLELKHVKDRGCLPAMEFR